MFGFRTKQDAAAQSNTDQKSDTSDSEAVLDVIRKRLKSTDSDKSIPHVSDISKYQIDNDSFPPGEDRLDMNDNFGALDVDKDYDDDLEQIGNNNPIYQPGAGNMKYDPVMPNDMNQNAPSNRGLQMPTQNIPKPPMQQRIDGVRYSNSRQRIQDFGDMGDPISGIVKNDLGASLSQPSSKSKDISAPLDRLFSTVDLLREKNGESIVNSMVPQMFRGATIDGMVSQILTKEIRLWIEANIQDVVKDIVEDEIQRLLPNEYKKKK